MIESTRGRFDGAQAPGLSLPLTLPLTLSEPPEPVPGHPQGRSAPGIALRSIPGLDAWSLACRRKTLRGVWRGWLLKSHKSVR
jgi:hypothetical protein